MKKLISIITLLIVTVVGVAIPTTSYAAPYGEGKYGENVPYGSQTTLSIATNGNVSIPISPSNSGTLATGTSNVTVTSTDVVGYKLYVRALNSTNMDNGGATLPTSANGSPATLAVNTWGYNTNVSPTNFMGLSLTDALERSVNGPVPSGDLTVFTYGVKIDLSKPAGNYVGTVVYTAVPQTN